MKKTGVTQKKRNRKREREKAPVQATEAKPQDYVRDIDGTFVGFHGFLPGAKLSAQQLQEVRRLALQRVFPRLPRHPVRDAKTSLYTGKLDKIWGSPLAVAKILAEELRTNPWVGFQRLAKEVQWHWNIKGFVPKMLKLLGKYLEEERSVFDQVDYDIVDIVNQHPDYTIKQITSELKGRKEYRKQKWGTLTKRVQRLLKHDPYVSR